MTSELKPCPFCGGKAQHNDGGNSVYGRFWWKVWCEDCLIQLADQEEWTVDNKLKFPPKECFERWNTRAAPEVPELVRYDWKDHGMVKVFDGEYVSHDQAVEVIADERNKNEQLLKRAQTSEIRHKDTTAAFERERKQSLQQQQEIKELDAKLAQINDQKPIGYVSGSFFESLKIDRFHSIAAYVMKDKTERYNHALYTAPVASDAETIDAHRYRYLRNQDVETIYKGGVFAGKTPDNIVLSGGDLDNAIDRALSGKEPS